MESRRSPETYPLRYDPASAPISSRSTSPGTPPLKRDLSPSTTATLVPSEYGSPVNRKRYKWSFEFLCLAISFLAIIASIYVLYRYDGEPIPEWSYRQGGFSINSVLSLLSALSRSSLLVPLDEAMGQLMWLAFMERERKLADVEVYNEAARGPLGAVKLIWANGGRGIETMGCFTVLMAMILGTAQQQLLAYPTHTRIVNSSAVLVGSAPAFYDTYTETTPFNNPDSPAVPTVDFPVAASMFASLNSESPVFPPFDCASGNCAYPIFTSLGVCAECSDESSKMSSSCDDSAGTCTANYESITSVNYRDSSAGYSTIVNQSSITNSSGIADIFTLASSTSFPPEYTATYCNLMWCIKTINATVTNSTYREKLLSTSTAAEAQPDGTAIFRYISPIDDKPGSFSVSKKAQEAFKTLAADLSGWSKRRQEKEYIHSSPLFAGIAEFTLAPPSNSSSYTSTSGSSTISPRSPMPQIAAALTTALRSSLTIPGQLIIQTTIIRVRWYWLSFSAAMWVCSALFLIITVWRSWRNEQRVGSWGMSSLALMLFGVRDYEVRERVGSWSGAEMAKRAKGVRVKLMRDGAMKSGEGGWELVRT